ncbi:MAG: MCE family protein, partial [Bacteroidetes bacterium]|nr:MCE family protein [Bacteroidota bacterium]
TASIGTDGLIGNKVINITPAKDPDEAIAEGDVLPVRRAADAGEMLRTLDKTNNDVAAIAANLKITVTRLNSSTGLWKLLNDSTLPRNLRASAVNVRVATARAAEIAGDLRSIVADVNSGKGTLGNLLRDSTVSDSISAALVKINLAVTHLDALIVAANTTVAGVQDDIGKGKGTINALLKDSLIAARISNSLGNIEKGTDAFSQDMEALKHNFLFRGYFRKLEKQKAEQKKLAGN